MGLSDSSPGRTTSACGLVQPVAEPPAPSEVSRVQRLPFTACCPCYPGGGHRYTSRTAWRRLLPSPVFERLGLPATSHGATSGFAARYGPQFRSRGVFAPLGILAPLLLDTSRHHAGSLATRFVRLFFGVNSFHFTRKGVAFVTHPRTPRAEERWWVIFGARARRYRTTFRRAFSRSSYGARHLCAEESREVHTQKSWRPWRPWRLIPSCITAPCCS